MRVRAVVVRERLCWMRIQARVGSGCWLDEMQIKEEKKKKGKTHLHHFPTMFHFEHEELRTVSQVSHAREL